jgi:hypothetical protein
MRTLLCPTPASPVGCPYRVHRFSADPFNSATLAGGTFDVSLDLNLRMTSFRAHQLLLQRTDDSGAFLNVIATG